MSKEVQEERTESPYLAESPRLPIEHKAIPCAYYSHTELSFSKLFGSTAGCDLVYKTGPPLQFLSIIRDYQVERRGRIWLEGGGL